MRLLLWICFCHILATNANKSYKGYKVLRTEKLDKTQVKLLKQIQTKTRLDFWNKPTLDRPAEVMFRPDFEDKLSKFLTKHEIKFNIMIDDVEDLIQKTKPSMIRAKSTSSDYSGASYDMNWDDYCNYTTINAFLDALAAANKWAEVKNIGQSYEGRDMNVLAITKAGPGKPNVWIEAGIHAREWIAPAVATFITRELVENNAAHPEYLDELNWYILPSANPDGYAFSWEHERMWRKTRSDQGKCKGVDPNRNWDFHWGESGVSQDKCNDQYLGPEPFSEIETKNIRDFVKSLDPVPILTTNFHSNGQLWLWPYGYKLKAYPKNYEENKQLAEDASEAVKEVHGTFFNATNSADLYQAAGASDDWYKGVLGSRFSFTVELRDTGEHGFILPPDQIIPSGEEIWAGFEVVIKKLIDVTKDKDNDVETEKNDVDIETEEGSGVVEDSD